ncbi:leukocyte elastase inhibitor-like isoform X2 [Harmonia axyridis]|uniref:leukocyte elastase inhibitor-like isoform X2 n=1 Tax=Harmonia axyridis TaxID=115357 RepID=UPI001E276C37|nr:leukocyte elastase inhibitor-like isoform X2 [Harmonia axyridis]
MKFLFLVLIAVTVCADDALKELQQGNIQFSSALYQQLIKTNPGNIIVSPLSVQLVLALTQLGAKGDTAQELTKGLYLPNSPEKVKEAFKLLLPKLKGNEFYKLEAANKVYIKEDYAINAEFQKLAEEIFGAGLENIDFVDTAAASVTINKWVEGKTNEKIKNLITPDMLSAMTRLVLVNAVYFNGNWSSPFDTYGTEKRKFFKSEKEEIEVATMQVTETFKYAENKDLDVRFLELPYDGHDVTFTIILPNQKEGLKSVEGRLNEVLLPQNYSYERVHLYLPKFRIENTFKLVPALKELGIQKAFDGDEADLTGFLADKKSLVISDVVQKAFINVTETGTEAAAATAAIVGIPLSAVIDEGILLEVDRPFLFYITHVGSKQILFVGRFSS